MTDRRAFLRQIATLATLGTGWLTADKAAWGTVPQEQTPGAAPADVSARVPDTLDLAEHGRLAINGMLGSLDSALDEKCVFLHILDVPPAHMLHWSSMVSGVLPKYIEVLPLTNRCRRMTR